MIRQLVATFKKEVRILMRDRGGLAILFLMPISLILIMAHIQDAPFRDYQELKVPMLIVNQDTGALGQSLENGLKSSGIFHIEQCQCTHDQAREFIKKGTYQVGILIPSQASASFNQAVDAFVEKAMADSVPHLAQKVPPSPEIEILFAPDIKKSFKVSITSALKQFSSNLISQHLLTFFRREMGLDSKKAGDDLHADFESLLIFKEPADPQMRRLELNSVQHNVPAWTIFGMFFIVIPLSASLIREREDGTFLRIKTMPGSFTVVMVGKIAAYLLLCMGQCATMLLVGLYVLPATGLPPLLIGENGVAIALISLATGLAANGFGIFMGSVFKTNQQSSVFGAVSIVILAALGGIWIPVYIMPEPIRILSSLSPLSWSLEAFHQVFLLQASLGTVWLALIKLTAFGCVCGVISTAVNPMKNS